MSDINPTDPDSSAQAEKPDDTISLIDLIMVIVKRKWLIIGMTAVIMVLTLAFLLATARMPPTSKWNVLPNKYTPTVKVLLQDTSASSSLSSMLNQSGLSSLTSLIGLPGGGMTSNADLAQALLKSNTVEDAVAEKFGFVQRYGIKKNPKTSARKRIEKSLTAVYDIKTGILEIGYEDIDPVFATGVINDITDNLQRVFKSLSMYKVTTKKLYLAEAITSAEKEAQEKSMALVAFQNKHGIYDLNAQSQATISAVAEMQSQLRSKQIDLALQRKYYPETDNRIVMLKNQIDQLQKQIEQLRAGTTGSSTSSLPMETMTQLGAEYYNLQSDVTVQQAILSMLKQQYEVARFQELDTSATFQIIEKAEVPEIRSSPSRSMIAVVATMAGFFISLLCAFIAEYFARVRRDPSEARKLDVIRSSLSFRGRHRRV